MLPFVKAWAPVLAMCLVIFLFSQDAHSGRHSQALLGWLLSLVGADTPRQLQLWGEPFRKLAHVIVYASLGGLVYRAFALGQHRFSLLAAGRSLAFTFLYACSDEYHQSFIPTRGPSFRDVLLDTAAALLALALIWAWRRRRAQPAPPPRLHAQHTVG